MTKPKVTVLMTGGTINQRSRQDGVAVMDFGPEALAAEIGVPDIVVKFERVMQKGSKDIVPDDWVTIARAASNALSRGADGLVVVHGTDTMHYSAAALSFMLQEPGRPIVFTGSMIPGGDAISDSIHNLRDSIRIAAQADLGEICVVFSGDAERTYGTIIRGTRARKVRSYAIHAFESINASPLGRIDQEWIALGTDIKPRSSAQARLSLDLEQNVVLIKPTPATTPEMLRRQLTGAAGAVLEGTGIGHIKADLLDVIVSFGKPTVMATQPLYGGERLGLYETDRLILQIPNVIPARDMSSDTALVKLMWALKQPGDIKALMQRNLAGEISEPNASGR
jgi:L-asparaginase type I